MWIQINIRHTQLHLASPQTRLRTHSSRNASQRASVVGLRGSFASSLPLDGTTPPDSHMPSLPSANSTLFPAKASGSMQYFRIPAGTSPIHTDCVRALPPLRLAATNRWAAACRSCLSPLPRGSTGSTSGHLRRTCPQDARCRRWARLRGALPRRCWPILGREKPSSLRANPLRTRMEVWLQNRHEEKTRLAQLVADSSETLGEVDGMSWNLERKRNACGSLEDTDSWLGGTFLPG